MKYFLGIDAGTENAGFALTDEDYKLIKVRGKNAIGVTTYKAAQTAVSRRGFRTTRRRLKRRQFRVDLLQEIFNDIIMAKDVNFLRKLDENDLKSEDRQFDGKYSLFNDKMFNDKLYYKAYPTIYHLRKALMEKPTDDIRLLYLAVHHIIKYRGHFLVNGSINECTSIKDPLERINELLNDRNEQIVADNLEDAKINIIQPFLLDRLEELKDLVSNKGDITKELLQEIRNRSENSGKVFITRKDKKQKAYELLGVETSSQRTVVNTIFGDKVNLKTIFGADEYPEVAGFYFSDDIETVEDQNLLRDNVTDYELIMQLKAAYDWYILNDLLQGEESISKAMVKIYDTHKKDLKDLKELIKTYDANNYDIVFGLSQNKKEGLDNYTAYIGGGRIGDKKVGNNGRLGKTCTQVDFYKFIKKTIGNIKTPMAEALKNDILARIENGDFMPKIVSKNNSAIPHQLNLLELDKILQAAVDSGSADFLKKEENGWTNMKKIKSLLTFRIPYYVGPVKFYKEGEIKSKNAWAVRKREGRVTPWTYHDLINESASNTLFIGRMTNKCTYLKDAVTLPKNSILFSKYNSLNELNKLKINGEEINIDTKQKIFNDIYMNDKVTVKKIYRYLIDVLGHDKDIKVTGYDTELKGNMNTYHTYKKVLLDKVDKYPEMIEELIFLSTIHPDSAMIAASAKEKYSHILTENEINGIKGFKFNGWSSLSAKFLSGYKNNGIKLTYEGEFLDLVDIMYNTNQNLQQILNSSLCNYAEALEEYNQANGIVENINITYKDVEEMYCSPSVKRCIWQTFGLVKDLIKQTKIIPDVIFLESTRTNTDKKKGIRSQTRREKIQNAYAEANKKSKELFADIETCNKQLTGYSDSQLNSEKLYLYFMQLGKCMYTGENVDLDRLFTQNCYDVDHILPKAKIKDDSLSNKVLVLQRANKEKSDDYPVPRLFRQVNLWKKLHKADLLGDRKLTNLIRTSDVSREEQDKFINRQLVETSQTVMLLNDLLDRHFQGATDKKVEIVLSRAANVSDFRKEYGLTKSRDVNDFHHGSDAYLNIVVGNILNKGFNHNWSYRSNENRYDKSFNFANHLKREVTKSQNAILNTVYEQLNTCDFRVTKKIEENKGELYKATLFAAEDNDNSVLYGRNESKIVDGIELNPKSNPRKYGGYKTSGTSYFVVVDSENKKGMPLRTIEAISIFDRQMLALGKKTMGEILATAGLHKAKLARIKGLKDAKLKVGSLLDFGAFRLRLSGLSKGRPLFHNANQLYVTSEQNAYIKEISITIDKVNKLARFIKKEDKEEALRGFVNDLEEEKKKRLMQKNQTSTIVLLTSEKNMSTYVFFVDKLSHNPYKNIPTYSSLLTILQGSREFYEALPIYEQIVLLLNILCAFQCNALKVDVSGLEYEKKTRNGIKITKGGKEQCSISINKDITKDNIYFISQSPSGLKENRIKITK